MNVNEVTIDGVEYVAEASGGGCYGCAFEFDSLMADTCRRVRCLSEERADAIDVIFIAKPADEEAN